MQWARGFAKLGFLSPLMSSRSAMLESFLRALQGALAVLTLVLAAWWLTQWTAPRKVAVLPTAGQELSGVATESIRRLFGGAQTSAASVEGVRLSGVFRNSDGAGFATFNTSKGAVAAFIGDDIVPGVKLKAIETGRVLVLVAGAERELRLFNGQANEQPGGQTNSQAPANVVGPGMSPQR